MRVLVDTNILLDYLLCREPYEKEIIQAEKDGYLQKNTVKTYLLHSGNFIKWCKDEFEPGGRNK